MTATLIEPPSTHVEPASGWVDDLMFEFAISRSSDGGKCVIWRSCRYQQEVPVLLAGAMRG